MDCRVAENAQAVKMGKNPWGSPSSRSKVFDSFVQRPFRLSHALFMKQRFNYALNKRARFRCYAFKGDTWL